MASAAMREAPSLAMGGRSGGRKAWWIDVLAPYAQADVRRSVWCLLTSVVAYVALWPVMYYLLDVSYALTLLVAIAAAGFIAIRLAC